MAGGRLYEMVFRIGGRLAASFGTATTAAGKGLTDLERKAEAQKHVFEIVKITEQTVDPAEWGKNYPRQYDTYRRTVDIERTRFGGSATPS